MAMESTQQRISATAVVTGWLNRRLRPVLESAYRSSFRHVTVFAAVIILACGICAASYTWVTESSLFASAVAAGILAMIVSLLTAAAFYPVLRQRSRWLLEATSTIAHDYFDLLSVLGKLTELRNGEAAGHNLRVTVYTLWFAEQLGFTPAEVVRAAKGALLHDVGKLAIPDRILQKAGPLAPDERAEMTRHVGYGLEIIAQSSSLQDTTPIVAAHHERYDGRGYPLGMKGEAIPREARMFALVDVFDALTSARSYKPAYSVEEALAEMAQGRGAHFDPDMFDRFAQLVPDVVGQLPKDEVGLTELLMDRLTPYLNHVVHVEPELQEEHSSGAGLSAADFTRNTALPEQSDPGPDRSNGERIAGARASGPRMEGRAAVTRRERVLAWAVAGIAVAASIWFGATLAHGAVPTAVPSLSQVFKRVDQSVVVIRTSEHLPTGIHGVAAGTMSSFSALGSGVLVTADGKVVTAAHVIQTADKVDVEFADGTLVPARIVASDAAADVALLQLDRVPPTIAPVEFGNSDMTEVGDQIFVVGAPLGIGHTLTVGHVSARRQRNATYSGLVAAESFQTDAAINRGNSGGPMFDMNGKVVGIVTHIVTVSGGSEGLGFVVTSNMARRLLFEEPSVWSGLDGYLLTDKLANAFNLPTTGLLVQRVAHGSPAERLGLRAGRYGIAMGDERLLIGGDVIVAVDGIALADPDAYERVRRRLADARTNGGLIRLSVMRDGVPIELVAGMQP